MAARCGIQFLTCTDLILHYILYITWNYIGITLVFSRKSYFQLRHAHEKRMYHANLAKKKSSTDAGLTGTSHQFRYNYLGINETQASSFVILAGTAYSIFVHEYIAPSLPPLDSPLIGTLQCFCIAHSRPLIELNLPLLIISILLDSELDSYLDWQDSHL